MKKNLSVLVCLFFACSVFAQQKITVAIAANVQFVMNELKNEFQKETGITVDIVPGSSGKLNAQIKQGAPYDVFVSADMNYPQDLYASGFAVDSPKVYAQGALVLWTAGSALKPVKDLKVLTNADAKKIAIANPETAPYGKAATEAMKYFNVYDAVKTKLVYGESISQASHFIATQSADIGFTAKSIVLSDEMKGKGIWVDVDKKSYSPILQGVVILKYGKDNHADAAKKFYDFLFSKKAKAWFVKFGYTVK